MKKRSDGRYVKTITNPKTHKRISFYGTSMREINQKIISYEQKLNIGSTFEEVAVKWWEKVEPKLAAQSIRPYKAAFNRAVLEFGKDYIKDITPADINRFISALADQGLAHKTLSNQRVVINRIFSFAIISNDLVTNPCAEIEVPKTAPKSKRPAATVTDEEKIKSSEDSWLFPLIAIYSGLRKGEILALKWRDIDFNEDLIYVTKSVAHKGDTPFVKEPKTEAGCRMVPLLLPLKERLLKEKKRSPEHFIISDTGKTPLTKRRFETLYNHYKKDVGITATAHQLRHSCQNVVKNPKTP